MIEVANTEQNPELRRRAMQHLGTMGRTKTGDSLVGLYAKEKEIDIKRTIINALFTQNNAESLVAIARKETDPTLQAGSRPEAVDDAEQGGDGLLAGDLEQMKTMVAALTVAFAAIAQTSFDSGAAAGGRTFAQDLRPRLSNGRIEPHATTNIAKDLRALAATLTEPTWIGYTQPMIDGEHNMCDYWNDGMRYSSVDRSDSS